VTRSLLHRVGILLCPLEELLYMDFWKTIKESLHSLCSENLKSHDDLENLSIVLALLSKLMHEEDAKQLRYTWLNFESRIYTTTSISPLLKW